MKRAVKFAAWLLFLLVLVVAGAMLAVQGRGVSARPQPSWVEARTALFLRSWLTPPDLQGLDESCQGDRKRTSWQLGSISPITARRCHANDGSGGTEMGRSFYPKAPDMRLPRTQQLSDGEIFYFIENGIRMTGMPAWSTGTPEGEKASWELVHFIRRLSSLTAEDLAIMERFNPTSRDQIEEEQKVEDFLNGGDAPATPRRLPTPMPATSRSKPPQP